MKEFTTQEVQQIRSSAYQQNDDGSETYVGTDTFVVPTHLLPVVEKKFNSMTRSAKKLGVAAPSFQVIGVWKEPKEVVTKTSVTKILRSWSVVKVAGAAPKLAGYEFKATLDHTVFKNKVAVRTAPGKNIPQHYYAEDNMSHCEHCNKTRRRNETFVVYNENEDRHMKVGRQCLKDFLGGVSPTSIVSMLAYWEELAGMGGYSDDDWDGFHGSSAGRSYITFDLVEYLGRVAAVIRHDGWLPRSKVQEGDWATADQASYLMTRPFVMGRNAEREIRAWEAAREKYTPTEADEATVLAAIEWAKGVDSNSEYMHNIKAIAEEGEVIFKTMGVAASMVSAYNRAMERETERRVVLQKNNAHFGTIKKREEVVVKVAKKTSFDSAFGGGTRVTMFEEQTGAQLVWFANSSTADFVEGDVVRVKLTVKQHGEFNDMKQTVVTRVNYIEHTELTKVA